MERIVRKFTSHQEAARAERAEYRRLTSDERLDILRVLRLRVHGEDCPDLRESVESARR